MAYNDYGTVGSGYNPYDKKIPVRPKVDYAFGTRGGSIVGNKLISTEGAYGPMMAAGEMEKSGIPVKPMSASVQVPPSPQANDGMYDRPESSYFNGANVPGSVLPSAGNVPARQEVQGSTDWLIKNRLSPSQTTEIEKAKQIENAQKLAKAAQEKSATDLAKKRAFELQKAAVAPTIKAKSASDLQDIKVQMQKDAIEFKKERYAQVDVMKAKEMAQTEDLAKKKRDNDLTLAGMDDERAYTLQARRELAEGKMLDAKASLDLAEDYRKAAIRQSERETSRTTTKRYDPATGAEVTDVSTTRGTVPEAPVGEENPNQNLINEMNVKKAQLVKALTAGVNPKTRQALTTSEISTLESELEKTSRYAKHL